MYRYLYRDKEEVKTLEELKYEKMLNNSHFDDIKYNEDEPSEWNEMWKWGYFTYPYDEFRGVNAEMELAIDRQFQLIKQHTKLMFEKPKIELTEYMFITINPDPSLNISVKALYDKLCKSCKSTRIYEYLFVLEQRGKDTDEIGKGMHAHILIKHRFPKYCKLKEHFNNNFKSIVGNDKHIYILNCKNVSDVSKRIEYMTGKKNDEEKKIKQDIDKLWRQRWGIKDYYGNMEEPQSVAS